LNGRLFRHRPIDSVLQEFKLVGENYVLIVDALDVLFLTPLPGTRLWKKMESEGRITANDFPADWKYYTLAFPVSFTDTR